MLVSTMVEPLLGPIWGVLCLPTAEGPLVFVWPYKRSKPVVNMSRDARDSAAVQESKTHAEAASVRTLTACAFTPSMLSGVLLNHCRPSSHGVNRERQTGRKCGPQSLCDWSHFIICSTLFGDGLLSQPT